MVKHYFNKKFCLSLAVMFVCVAVSLIVFTTTIRQPSSASKPLDDRFSLDLSRQSGESSSKEQTIALDVETIPTYDGYIFLGYAWEATARTPIYVYDADTNTFTPNLITLTGDNPQRVLYAIWKDPEGLDIYYLQEMNSTICASMTARKVYTLVDNRDNVSYPVAKNDNGYCWMLKDLEYGSTGANHTYSSRSSALSACPSGGWSLPTSTRADSWSAMLVERGIIATGNYAVGGYYWLDGQTSVGDYFWYGGCSYSSYTNTTSCSCTGWYSTPSPTKVRCVY